VNEGSHDDRRHDDWQREEHGKEIAAERQTQVREDLMTG
jgi:hypothetical protein